MGFWQMLNENLVLFISSFRQHYHVLLTKHSVMMLNRNKINEPALLILQNGTYCIDVILAFEMATRFCESTLAAICVLHVIGSVAQIHT